MYCANGPLWTAHRIRRQTLSDGFSWTQLSIPNHSSKVQTLSIEQYKWFKQVGYTQGDMAWNLYPCFALVNLSYNPYILLAFLQATFQIIALIFCHSGRLKSANESTLHLNEVLSSLPFRMASLKKELEVLNRIWAEDSTNIPTYISVKS